MNSYCICLLVDARPRERVRRRGGEWGRGEDSDDTYVEVARVQICRVLCIGTPDVPECHIVDVAIAHILTRPSLETSSELSIQHPSVLNENVFNDVLLA